MSSLQLPPVGPANPVPAQPTAATQQPGQPSHPARMTSREGRMIRSALDQDLLSVAGAHASAKFDTLDDALERLLPFHVFYADEEASTSGQYERDRSTVEWHKTAEGRLNRVRERVGALKAQEAQQDILQPEHMHNYAAKFLNYVQQTFYYSTPAQPEKPAAPAMPGTKQQAQPFDFSKLGYGATHDLLTSKGAVNYSGIAAQAVANVNAGQNVARGRGARKAALGSGMPGTAPKGRGRGRGRVGRPPKNPGINAGDF